MSRAEPASQGRHARYEKTNLGMWASLGNDLSLREPKRQVDFLKINRTGKLIGKQSIDYSDPMAFLEKCELKQKAKHVKAGRVAYTPLRDYNCPSIRTVAQMERSAQKAMENATRDREKALQRTYAHSDGHEYEATALGLFACLPKQ
eukprot:g2485.t1